MARAEVRQEGSTSGAGSGPPASDDVAAEAARLLSRLGAVAINVREPFTYTSGAKSPIYCDNRLLISYPDERERIVGWLADRVVAAAGPEGVDVVAGTATAGIPFAAWVADRLRKPMIYVRGAAKEHGRGKQIEGRLEAGWRAVVIEDLITTGGSSLQTVEVIRRAGGVVDHCVAIFSYGLDRAREAYAVHGVTPIALSTIATLLEVAIADRSLAEDDRHHVETWLASCASE